MTPGVVLLFIDEDGYPVAHAADFHPSAPGGYSLAEGQRALARQQLALNVVNAYASPRLTRAFGVYEAQQVVDTLCRKHGCRVEEIRVGHEVAK